MSEKKTVVKKEIQRGGMTIKVIKRSASVNQMIEDGVISVQDAEMDKRARAAVLSAQKQAKVCNKPIAKYDKEGKEPYFVNASGERINFG